jgi:hypothetical protein
MAKSARREAADLNCRCRQKHGDVAGDGRRQLLIVVVPDHDRGDAPH